MKKSALVTGGNGFIGSFLVEKLLNEGYDVHCLVRKTSDLRWIKNLPVKLFYGALTQAISTIDPLKHVDVVFHLAAKKRAFKEEEYDDVNQHGTSNLLEECRLSGRVKKFVYLSSLAVVGPNPTPNPWNETAQCNPISFYGSSKLKGEEEVKKYSKFFSTTIIRPSTVYGPRDMDLLPLFKAVKCGIKPKLRTKEKLLSLCYVDDLVEALWQASQSDNSAGKTYFMCHKQSHSYNEMIDMLSAKLNKRGLDIPISETLMRQLAFCNEALAKLRKRAVPLNSQKANEILQVYWICSPEKIGKELGVVAKIGLDEGIAKSIEWYKANNYL